MAKNVGLIGAIRGTIGNTVFYVNQCHKVARVYQPVVSNPNTVGQIQQRTKLALAGRLSKIIPAAAIAGLKGSNKRDRRGEFVRLAVKSAVFSGNQASIPDASLVLSQGSVAMRCEHSSTYSVLGNRRFNINIVATPVASAPGTSYAERYVVFLINPTTSSVDFCRTGLLNMPTSSTAETTQVSITVNPNTASNYTVKVYVYPFSTSLDPATVDYSFVGSDEGNFVLVEGRLTAEFLNYGNSEFVPTAASRDDNSGDDNKKEK